MKCSATVPARWHTPAHQCTFAAVHGGLCAKHLDRPARLRHKIAALENEERQLTAMLRRAIAGVRQDTAKAKAGLRANP